MKLKVGQHIHLVGIGGVGLSAIARVLLGQGYQVSGSDRALNPLTEALARDGATIYEGHNAQNINGADALIITSAVKPDHIEVVAAREKGIPVYKRQDIIADLMEGKKVIAVTGTKGKTTTAAMIVHILRECGQNPSYIVGGVLADTGTNAGVANGETFVIEADEYEDMFLGLKPNIAVITNVEWDHPDYFKTPDAMIQSFRRFIAQVRAYHAFPGGVLIMCSDDTHARELLEENATGPRAIFAYGTESPTMKIPSYQASHIRAGENGETLFDIEMTTGQSQSYVVSVSLSLAGQHNVRNALAAFIATNLVNMQTGRLNAGYRASRLANALSNFKAPGRRFELRADINQIAILDDYAHNPMSIRAVLEAARQRYPGRSIWAVWQPHTYSRTQALMGDYLKAFDQAEHVLVTDIYAAREAPIEGVNSASFVKSLQHPDARHTATFADTVKVLREEVKSPAVIIIMSAGDAPQIGIEYLRFLEKPNG